MPVIVIILVVFQCSAGNASWGKVASLVLIQYRPLLQGTDLRLPRRLWWPLDCLRSWFAV